MSVSSFEAISFVSIFYNFEDILVLSEWYTVLAGLRAHSSSWGKITKRYQKGRYVVA